MATRGSRNIAATIVLLLAGVAIFAFVETHPSTSRDLGPRRRLTSAHAFVWVASIALAAIPGTRRAIGARLDRQRQPSPRARRIIAGVVFAAAVVIILCSASVQDRDLIPKFHDEHMSMLQTRLLAHGRMWTAAHPLADFFETFHVLVKPRYAAVYFPGTALMYVPSIWLGLKFWMMPVLVSGASCAVLYLVVCDLIDGVAGLLAGLMLVSLQWFRYLAMMVMSQTVMLLLGLLIVWSYLHWRRGEKKLAWAAAIGAFAGWAAVTRPVDALCFAAPVGIAMLIDLRRLPLRFAAKTIAVACVFALPFLSLQVIENVGLTGSPFKTPYRLYSDLYTPQMSFGFHEIDPTARPQSTLPQRQIYYDQFTVPALREHRADRIVPIWLRDRFPLLAEVALPNRLLLLLIPLSILAAPDRPRMAAWSVLVLYVLLYALFPYLLPMYAVVIAPVVILWALLGKTALEASLPPAVGVALTLAIAGLSIAAIPPIDRDVLDDGFVTPTMWFSYVELPGRVQTPAIVLFRFHGGGNGGDNVNEEPVYNVDVVNPDDAPIIRAHDLGLERNRELFDYYAQRQPGRTVYLYDRASRNLVELGNVADLARRFPVTRPARAS